MKIKLGIVITIVVLLSGMSWRAAVFAMEQKAVNQKQTEVLQELVGKVKDIGRKVEVNMKIADLEARIQMHKSKYPNPTGGTLEWLKEMERDLKHEKERRER